MKRIWYEFKEDCPACPYQLVQQYEHDVSTYFNPEKETIIPILTIVPDKKFAHLIPKPIKSTCLTQDLISDLGEIILTQPGKLIIFLIFIKRVAMRNNRLIMVLLFFCLMTTPALGEQLVTVHIQDYPPYMIKEAATPKGIIPEVFQLIAQKYNYTLDFKSASRKRVFIQLNSGKLDALPMAKEWVSDPENYEFTDIIVESRDVLFSPSQSPLQFESIEDLFGKKLGTHLGYEYPVLEVYFKDKRIKRRDAITEEATLGKTLLKRTDAAIVNALVGQWLIKQKSEWHGKFVFSQKEIGVAGYRILFKKEWKPFVEKFNRELKALKDDGTLESIIAQYK